MIFGNDCDRKKATVYDDDDGDDDENVRMPNSEVQQEIHQTGILEIMNKIKSRRIWHETIFRDFKIICFSLFGSE